MNKLRIAIIGAGPCGLSQLLAFKQAEQEQRIELVCFERQADWGGLWLYTSRIGIDAHGEPVHSSMYRHLWANGPKETIEYRDYTFYDHFGCHLPSFLPRSVMYDYITGRAKANNLRQFIRFNTAVRHVDFDDQNNQFDVDVEDLITSSTQHLHFDRVIVAVGHYHTPNMINIDGVDQFPGRVLHSHDFRGADEFVDLNLLIIGGRVSAEDIALQSYKFGVKSVTISSRNDPIPYKWPPEIKTASMLVRMEGRTAHFKDGSTVHNIDAIIFCTGYRHHYPFMAKHLRLHSGITQCIPPSLYKCIFWIDQPNLAYIGSINSILTLATLELQIAVVRDVFLGHIGLPNIDQQQADMNEWNKREKEIEANNIFAIINLEFDYMRDMISLLHTYDANRNVIKFNFDKATNMVQKYFGLKLGDVFGYRDLSYESLMDGENREGAQVYKPWLENMDDSLEGFLNNYREKL